MDLATAYREAVLGSRNRILNILMISRCPPWPLHLGDRLIVYNLARELEKHHHRIHLLAFYQRPTDLADTTYYEQFFHDVQLVPEPERSGVSYMWRRFSKGARLPTRASQCWSPEMWRRIQAKKDAERNYDIVHLFGSVTVYEYYHLIREFPNIITPYESYSLLLETQAAEASGGSIFARLNARLRVGTARRYESWMFSDFGRTVVVSKKDAALIQQLDPAARVAVIPNGVDIDRFSSSNTAHKQPVVMFTGNFGYKPNFDAAMILIKKIYPRIRKHIPQVQLMLVGADPPPALQSFDKMKGITVTGRVPDMRVYLDQATVFVSPLQSGAGIKNKILEAMAMSCPVVATPISLDGIDVSNNKNVFIVNKPSEMAEWAVALIKNPALAERIGAAGRALVEEKYTWSYVADQYEDLYERIIAKHKQNS
ncbi:MAG: glycosyltransferase [Anaerolineae bacterium]|nr:glycosyltransferase [Anaerolineae bacterium]